MSEFLIVLLGKWQSCAACLIRMLPDGRFVGLVRAFMIEAEYDLMKTARSHFSGRTGHR
jgi:hypothetical protein